MNRTTKVLRISLVLSVAFLAGQFLSSPGISEAAPAAKAKKEDKSSFEAEKAAALANPYANDMPWLSKEERDKFVKDFETNYVKTYPANYQKGFSILKAKCAKCHEAVRPINSQFTEPAGKDPAERSKKAKEILASDSSIAKNKNVWQVEGDIWQRYVKRMMAKPGCEISKDEGKEVWSFLTYDSNQRKVGAKKAEWEKHRGELLKKFKESNPARYKELYEAHSEKAKQS